MKFVKIFWVNAVLVVAVMVTVCQVTDVPIYRPVVALAFVLRVFVPPIINVSMVNCAILKRASAFLTVEDLIVSLALVVSQVKTVVTQEIIAYSIRQTPRARPPFAALIVPKGRRAPTVILVMK